MAALLPTDSHVGSWWVWHKGCFYHFYITFAYTFQVYPDIQLFPIWSLEPLANKSVKDFHKILRKQGVCNSDKAWRIIKKAFVRPNTYSEVSICSNQRHRKRLYLDSLVLLCVKCNNNIYVVMRSKWDRIWNSLEKKHVIQLYKGQVTKTIQSRLY